MHIYLKGYYGYKNRGDELLLLGLIDWLWEEYHFDILSVEAGDPVFLSQWISDCKKIVKWTHLDKVQCVGRKKFFGISLFGVSGTQNIGSSPDLWVFGGGEVFSDARPFPYNGWNYLLGFWKVVGQKKFIVLGGIGTVKKQGTRFLYKQLLGRAQKIVVRDKDSYNVALGYKNNKSLVLYHDFAYDVLEKIVGQGSRQTVKKLSNIGSIKKPYILINVNIYLRNQEVIDKCRQLVKQFPQHHYYFFSAALGSDETMLEKLQDIFPGIQLYDWTQHTLEESLRCIQQADFVLGARLHVLLVAQYFTIPFDAIVYQEKIEKVVLKMKRLKN